MPWLKMITPTAPAAAAFSAFTSKLQLPRWMRAIEPLGKPVKSSTSQPLVEVLPAPRARSTAATGALTSPGSVCDR
ncbi:hypothetical protein D9M73_191080 [compost metagenome]